MPHLFVFGLGYAAGHVVSALPAGWQVTATSSDGHGSTLAFADEQRVRPLLAAASHVLVSIPPIGDQDIVLVRYGDALPTGAWLGYLSSTGVYGDAGGAWVDEDAPITGRRAGRNAADAAWLERGARVFRLPGIYGPGRSPLDRVRSAQAHRTGIADQVFSRIHVADLAAGVIAGFDAPPGAYNLADDLPASQDEVVAYAAELLGLPPPPLVTLDQLTPAARAFYAENRRVANGKAKRVLGWRPRYATYRLGLRDLKATTSPTAVSAAPTPASSVQR